MTAQTFRLVPKPQKAILVLLLAAVLVFVFQEGYLPELTYLGSGIFVFPALMLLVAALGGILPSAAALLGIAWVSASVYGPNGWLILLYLLPPTLAFLVCLEKEIPFFQAAGIVFLALAGGLVLTFLVLQQMVGGSLYTAASKAAIEGLNALKERDAFLFLLWRSGFLSFTGPAAEAAMAQAQNGVLSLDAATVEEFFKQITARVTQLLSSLLPGLLTTFSITNALLGTGFALKLAVRAQTAPSLGMPPFSQWHLPRSAGRYMMALSLGYLLALFSGNPVLQTAGQMMYNVFFALYAIQGLAYINFILKRRGTKRPLRLLAVTLMYAILSLASMLLGLMDQVADPRKLRGAPPRPTE